jgi:photosystem II stability/assembly factor-like uncharacterized protein
MSRFCHRPISKGLLPLSVLLTFSLLLCPSLRATPQVHSQTRPQRAHPQPATQQSQTTQPAKFKGIFEPVNYNQDLTLFDAFFVSPEEGWVSGAAGTILHTVDGGRTWTAQLGGDPHSQGPELKRIFFLDRTHGWAQSWNQLFRTTDGENWQEVGNDVRGYAVFVSPQKGFRVYGSTLYATRDGGANWKEGFSCHVQALVDGLTREIACDIYSLQFISPLVGYGVGSSDVVVKTADGGITWQVRMISLPAGDARISDVFLLDDSRGVVNRGWKWYRTTDGGGNWQGVIAPTPGDAAAPRFADPEVGWSCHALPASSTTRLTYTADGGAHWFSRDFQFPAPVSGFSLPRRDRAYIVGDHGMIYRYRVVPVNYQAAAHFIDAPAMPGFDSPVFGEVATLNDVVAKLRAKLPAVAAPSGQATIQSATQPSGQASVQASAQAVAFQQDMNTPGSTGASSGAPSTAGFPQDAGSAAAGVQGGFQQATGAGPVPGGYLDSCCGPLIQQLETTANSFATSAPVFSQRFRSLNLIFEGLNFLNSVVNQANTLKQSVRALRQAKNAQAASVALATVQSQVTGISSGGGFTQDTTLPPQP